MIENLPLGKYRVEEVKAPYGFTLNTSVKEVNFVYVGQDVPVVKETVSFTDERQKVSLLQKMTSDENGQAVCRQPVRSRQMSSSVTEILSDVHL